MEKKDFIEKDTRTFIIKTNPNRKSNFKVMRDGYKRDANGKEIKNGNGEGFQTQQIEVNDIVIIPGASQIFTPPRRGDNNRLLTGLDVDIENPYKTEEYFPDEKFEKALKGKSRVKLQTVLEYEHGVEFDYYTSDIPSGLIPKDNRKFFQTKERFLPLGNGITYLKMSNPRDRVMYYALTARHPSVIPTVAASYDELVNGVSTQHCKWYFVDETERENIQISKLQYNNKIAAAIEALADSKNKTAIIDMVKAIGIDGANDQSITAERAYILLDSYAKTDVNAAKLFLDHYEIWKDKVRRPEIEVYAEIFDLKSYDLIRVKNNKYEVILRDKNGNSEIKLFNTKSALAKEFMMDPAYKEYVDDLRSSLKAARM